MMEENKFKDVDFREFTLIEGKIYKISIYQIEIMRLIKMCDSNNSNLIADKLRRAIYIKDYLLNQVTDFQRDIPKSNIENYFLSPREQLELKINREKLDKNMTLYYKREK